jgi:hypothetical protein
MGINSCISVTTQPRESIRPVLAVRIREIGIFNLIVTLQLEGHRSSADGHQRPSVRSSAVESKRSPCKPVWSFMTLKKVNQSFMTFGDDVLSGFYSV